MFRPVSELRVASYMCVALLWFGGCKDRGATSPTAESRSIETNEVESTSVEVAPDELDSERVQLTPRDVEFGAGGATLASAGGTIVAGDSRLEVPAGAMRERGILQIESFAVSEVDAELPRGVLLAAGSSEPANLGLSRVAKFYVPLQFEVPDDDGDIELELLSWHPSLGTWLTTSYAEVSTGDTTALFYTDYIGTFVVRARPTWDEERLERCDGATLNLGESIPGNEDRAVGTTAAGESMTRRAAFSVLSDSRVLGLPSYVSFKNEERRDLPGRIAADERNHQDEDYLMDPQLAESLEILGELVSREWRTRFSDEPAYDLRITEAFDSLREHRDVSTHYQGRALDLTLTPLPRGNLATRRAFYGRLSRLAVCAGVGYSLFENRFHVHVSSPSTKVALLVEHSTEPGWSVWIYDFSHPHESSRLHSGDGEMPVKVSWGDRGRIRLWDDGPGLIGDIDASGQLRRLDKHAETYRVVEELGGKSVRVVDGRAFLVNAGAAFSPGTVGAGDNQLAFDETIDITPPEAGAFVRDSALLETEGVRAARERYSVHD